MDRNRGLEGHIGQLVSASPAHPALVAAFEAFDRGGVRWCLLRLPDDLAAPGGDVDLLIARADHQQANELLAGVGFVRLPAWTRGRQFFFVSYHRTSAEWIFLHIVTELGFGPDRLLRTDAAPACLARRRYVGTVAMLAPDDAFWALLLHCLLDKDTVAPRHRERLRELATAAQPDGPLARIVDVRCPPGWTPLRLVEAARREQWGVLVRLAPALLVAWARCDRIGARQRWLARGLRLVDRVANLWPRRGLSVALLGPDGAGKSTLAAGIRNGFIFPVRVIYMGLHTPRLRRIARLRPSLLALLGRLCVLWGRYLLAQYHRARGRLVVFDRYTFDASIPPRDRPIGPPPRSRWVDARTCPAPDLVFVLDVDGETMFERKRHRKYRPEDLESARRHYGALRHRLPQIQVVDAAPPREEVCAEVIERIWHHYAARWRGT